MSCFSTTVHIFMWLDWEILRLLINNASPSRNRRLRWNAGQRKYCISHHCIHHTHLYIIAAAHVSTTLIPALQLLTLYSLHPFLPYSCCHHTHLYFTAAAPVSTTPISTLQLLPLYPLHPCQHYSCCPCILYTHLSLPFSCCPCILCTHLYLAGFEDHVC